MKKIFSIISLAITLIATAQAPQGFNYQATVRNSSGALIVNQNVYFKFNLMLNSVSSVLVFSETHYTPTDDLGQVNLVIGTGTATTGSFSTINWGTGNYYLGIELNTGSGYVAMGTTQLLSVPFALYAEKSGSSATPATNGLNALIKTTDEPAGANCTSGGTKLEVGLDANKNGLLDDTEVNATQTKYVCNGINAQPSNSGSVDYFLSVNNLPIPIVKGSCEKNGGLLENIIASAGSWWTLPSAIGWYSCYTSPNGLWWGGCGGGPLSEIKPTLCGLQISSPVQSQIIHSYTNFNSNKVQYNIKSIGQCFDTNVTFKFYDTNNNLIPSFVEYKRGVLYSGSAYLPVNTTYLSSNKTQTYTILMSDYNQTFYEHSLTFFMPQNATRLEIVFDGLAASNFSQSCLQSLYTTRTPAGYGSGAGTNNGRYYFGSIDYTLLKWQ